KFESRCKEFINVTSILREVNTTKGYIHHHEDVTKATLVIMESSGTTGPSKGAMFSHFKFVKIFLRKVFKVDYNYKLLGQSPIAHASGFMTFLQPMVYGDIVVAVKNANIDSMVYAIEKYKTTFLVFTPHYLSSFIKLSRKPDLSSVKFMFTGGAKITMSVADAFIKRFGIPDFRQAYGSTELGFMVTFTQNMVGNLNNSIGKIEPYMKVKIIDPDTGELLGPNQKGEIVATGPSIFDGYHDQPELTAAAIKDGWFYTGDIGYYDEDENFFIVDRIKDVIKQNSFGFSPSDIEDVLIQHDAIAEVAVVGIPDQDAGELAHAFIVLKPRASITSDEIRNFANERLTPLKRIKGKIHFVDSIQKTAIGKPLRRKLREEYLKNNSDGN
ncbi:4-coumarate--CoA ligase-like 7, partial [Dinothrombium tinctorium]